MARMTTAQRDVLRDQAYLLSIQGQGSASITRAINNAGIEVSEPTVRKLIREEVERRASLRDERETDLLVQHHVDQLDAVANECWKRLAKLKDTSLNVSGLLGTARAAYVDQARVLGLLINRSQQVTGEEVSPSVKRLEELLSTPVQVEIPEPAPVPPEFLADDDLTDTVEALA